jgi:hypothetical protein
LLWAPVDLRLGWVSARGHSGPGRIPVRHSNRVDGFSTAWLVQRHAKLAAYFPGFWFQPRPNREGDNWTGYKATGSSSPPPGTVAVRPPPTHLSHPTTSALNAIEFHALEA